MNNNKFNKFYSKKSIDDLFIKLLTHKITNSVLDKEWNEALKNHLEERLQNEDSRKLFEKILHTAPEVLKQEEEQILIELKNLKELDNSTNINSEKSGANAAGKSLKNVVNTALILILFTIIGVIISVTSNDVETIKITYVILGIVNLICTLLVLYNLYLAGDHLENS